MFIWYGSAFRRRSFGKVVVYLDVGASGLIIYKSLNSEAVLLKKRRILNLKIYYYQCIIDCIVKKYIKQNLRDKNFLVLRAYKKTVYRIMVDSS